MPRTKLTDDECALPIGAIWNHPLLLSRVSDEWDPTLNSSAVGPGGWIQGDDGVWDRLGTDAQEPSI